MGVRYPRSWHDCNTSILLTDGFFEVTDKLFFIVFLINIYYFTEPVLDSISIELLHIHTVGWSDFEKNFYAIDIVGHS